MFLNKTGLAPHVGASLEMMQSDSLLMRGEKPFVFTSLRHNKGVTEVLEILHTVGGLRR